VGSRKIEEQLDRISGLRGVSASEAVPELRKALTSRIGVVVAKAAKVAGESQFRELIADIAAAFERLFEDAVQRDPQCLGKTAAAKALSELDYRESELFLRGARHVQMEPVWGGQDDTASPLRGVCLLGLAAATDIRRDRVLRCLVDGVTDPKANVRVEAVRALAHMAGDEGSLLLRFKAKVGDSELSVVGQVFDCLLALEREEAVPFVASFLDSAKESIPEEAALALGASRLLSAIDILEKTWDKTKDPDLRLAVLRGLSASREKRAIDFLLAVLKDGRPRDSQAALEALSIHKGTPEIREMVEKVLGKAAF
jgi:hypothetical protein